MSSHHELPRALDHLVLPVHALDEARARLTRLGFTVAADARHPFGTENACVFFADNTYLEPLGVASREECEAAAIAGNVFVARDQAFRFRSGGEGLSAIVVASSDAAADHARFCKLGISGGEMVTFERPVRLLDGRETTAAFRLAFAGDLRSPDFFLFACERVNPLPANRGALERHENAVTGIAAVVLSEENPSDFQYLLEEVVDQREIEAHSFGITVPSANARIKVLTPEGLSGFFGAPEGGRNGSWSEGSVPSFSALPIVGVTEKLLAANGVGYTRRGDRLIVPHEPGQGAHFVFQENS